MMSRCLSFFLFTLIFAATVLLTQPSLAAAAGFSQGNGFTVNRLRADVMLYCHDPYMGYQTKWVWCDADLWTPGRRDYFVGPVGNADKVHLQATRQDGSQASKDADYDGATGRSKSSINLGIHTLLQKPLLKIGVNQIQYQLKANGQSVNEGTFTATVQRGPDRFCPNGSYTGSSIDCDFAESICDRHFENYNYCQ